MRIQSIQNYTPNQSTNFKAKFVRNSVLEKFTKETVERLDRNYGSTIPSEAKRLNKIFYEYLEKFRNIKYDYPIEMSAAEDVGYYNNLRFHFPRTQKYIFPDYVEGDCGPKTLSYNDRRDSAFTYHMKQFMWFVDELAENFEKYTTETAEAKKINKIIDSIT